MKKVLLQLSLLIFGCSAFAQESQPRLLELVDNTQIEVLIQKPQEASKKLLLCLHGGEPENGLHVFPSFWYEHWTAKGYIVAAVSLPGFGKTAGIKDFCGPSTLQTLLLALDTIKREMDVEKIGVIGFGIGGQAGLLLAAKKADISCVACSSAAYNLEEHLSPTDPLVASLFAKKYVVDISLEAFKLRSPIEFVSSIQAPVLLLYRKNHPWIKEAEVVNFMQAMKNADKDCSCIFLEERQGVQHLFLNEIFQYAESWIDQQMR